jgi:repressor of nif and glnA expression
LTGLKHLSIIGKRLPTTNFRIIENTVIGVETQEVERKELSILKVLSDSSEPMGARVIAQHLKDLGVDLGERAVRYHLKILDERGLTELVGRDGRLITSRGHEELGDALVRDKVGFALSRIEQLAFRTDFNLKDNTGLIPVNVSYFRKREFSRAVQVMKPIFSAGLCVSSKVAVAYEGERLGELTVPRGAVGLATVCSIALNGALLKAGIPMDSKFGGILQMRDNKPLRFVELIQYAGSSLDPTEVFIRAKMTTVRNVAKRGEGKMLANFREIPAMCRPVAEEVLGKLKKAGIDGIMVMGNTSDAVCEISVEQNRVGMVIIGGSNPVAAAEEAGIEAENHCMSTIMEYKHLINYKEL